LAFRPWLRILELVFLCSLIGAAGMVAGVAPLLTILGVKLLLLSGLAVVSMTLALFALIVAFSSTVAVRGREFGDWV